MFWDSNDTDKKGDSIWDGAGIGAALGTLFAGPVGTVAGGALGGLVDSFFGPGEEKKDEGPISVPVTAEMEENARQMNARADKWEADGHKGTAGDEQMAKNLENFYARQQGFPDKAAADNYRGLKADWDKALDAYIAGKGPNPGSQRDFMQKNNKVDDAPVYFPEDGRGRY